MLSAAVEDYLKAIYLLQEDGPVAMSELAERLNVAAASVTGMAKRLDRLGLVAYRSYRGVSLTPAGRKIAIEIVRHHRLLETYLREVMGYDWASMHAEAELLEHHISEAFEQRIDEMLGHPTHDPHGHPIPTVEGSVPLAPGAPLAEAEPGVLHVVRRVSDSDPDRLDRLEASGLMPGATVQIEPPSVGASGDGSPGVRLRIDGAEAVVPDALLEHVFVEPTDEDPIA